MSGTVIFHDREDAGKQLASALSDYKNDKDVLILALPRGGVPVAYKIAKYLHVPLDIFLVRKLGVPGHKELAMGAIASGGVKVMNDSVVMQLGIHQGQIDAIEKEELQELKRRELNYRQGRPLATIKDKKIILVDDGIATGATMKAAVKALQKLSPKKITIAVPVAASSTLEELSHDTDEIVCLSTPEPLYGVGMWYENFSQTSDEEVCALLNKGETQ